MGHTFHIPVLGLGYSIDTPLKVARYGISSAISIVDDELIERIRKYYSELNDEPYTPIDKHEYDSRAKRITAYLNLVNKLVTNQLAELSIQPFGEQNEIERYFDLLPEFSVLKQGYELMTEYPEGEKKQIFGSILRERIIKGAIDVNIMAKVDKLNIDDQNNSLGDHFSDALAALRGYACSELESSIVLSAGMNPRLYSYFEEFPDFFPDAKETIKKKIILKVSDFRSAFIQAKFLAKKGLWVSEFRIESGLNCGGHAFATEGYLLGPILQEFKERRAEMLNELFTIYQAALIKNDKLCATVPHQKVSVQGGIGTADENQFLLEHYELDATGWGSPFLLVPEATNVDHDTLAKLTDADSSDFYLSDASPLGILFNNFKGSSIDEQRVARIEKGRPGSPCTKKYLCTNTEFTEIPICTASREYQNLKIKQLQEIDLPEDEYNRRFETITDKICLCDGLCSSAYIKLGINKPKESKAVAICPGPNLAYFNRTYTLDEMVKHIYGAKDLLENVNRPHVFIKELNLYTDYLKTDLKKHMNDLNDKKKKSLNNFKNQLQQGIAYYKQLVHKIPNQSPDFLGKWFSELTESENMLNRIVI